MTVPPDRSVSAAFAAAARIEGWLSEDQALRLWRRVRVLQPGVDRRDPWPLHDRARAGGGSGDSGAGDRSARRRGTEAPGESLRSRRWHADYEIFHANLEASGVANRVQHVRLSSTEALASVNGAVDLLYIDSAHRYARARGDIERWGSRIAPGGVMLVHDSFNAIGVTLAQLRLLVVSSKWRYCGRSGSLAEYRREELSGRAAVVSVLRQLAQLAYFARNLLVKAVLVAHLERLARLLGHRDNSWPH